MLLSRRNGALVISADRYSLTFAADRPYVYLQDAQDHPLVELFALSSVHPLEGRDDTTAIGRWDVEESPGEIVVSVHAESSTWKSKIYRFRCSTKRLAYEVEVDGHGQLAEVNYFGGYYSGEIRWGSGFFSSGQHLTKGYNPEPNTDEENHFAPSGGSSIDLTGVPLPGRGDWFFTPPPFCFAFQSENGWMGVGVEAGPGAKRFTEFCYNGRGASFYLTLSFEGHTRVAGKYLLPSIGFDFGADEMSVLAAHVEALSEADIMRPALERARAPWWSEPIFCGWGEQCYLASEEQGHAPDYARQGLYERFLETLAANGVCPGTITIDDKWQAAYGENRVDETKWPDLGAFIEKQHRQGRHVLLWLKAWDCEGLAPDECITNAHGLPLAVDPTNPRYERRLREQVRRMLSPDGYDADGFKIDFSARIPSGPGISTYGDAWGLELMKLYLGIIYDESKKCKPDALVITHTAHPYLADVVDMIRLNDINMGKDVLKAMRQRARVAGIACPGALIDTDNWPNTDKSSWREYVAIQPRLGVPSLYYATHIDSTGQPLEPADYALIREVWAEQRLERKKPGFYASRSPVRA